MATAFFFPRQNMVWGEGEKKKYLLPKWDHDILATSLSF